MKLFDAIAAADELAPNVYNIGTKLRWLSDLDGKIHAEIIDTHEGGCPGFYGYDVDSGHETVLLACKPYDDLYIKYLLMQFDFYNGETARYNNSAAAFQTAYGEFSAWYNRTHAPKSGRKVYW